MAVLHCFGPVAPNSDFVPYEEKPGTGVEVVAI